jgi:hypothetical protein
MLANTPAAAAPGQLLVETYVYDVTADARFDATGARRTTARTNDFGSLSYLVFGIADHLAFGMTPTIGFNTVSDGPSSSRVGLGDLSAFLQYQLTQFQVGSWRPTTALNVEETFPTGTYDRLGERPTDGLGSGAYTTTVSLYSQTYFWMPNGRILRMRLDLSQAFSRRVDVSGVSVYGTGAGFSGHASPGDSFAADASWEYSLTRSWVLASDVVYHHVSNTRVTGSAIADAIAPALFPPRLGLQLNSGTSDFVYVAPAIEYSWTSNLGVLLGVRVTATGRNAAASLTPALAINYVR